MEYFNPRFPRGVRFVKTFRKVFGIHLGPQRKLPFAVKNDDFVCSAGFKGSRNITAGHIDLSFPMTTKTQVEVNGNHPKAHDRSNAGPRPPMKNPDLPGALTNMTNGASGAQPQGHLPALTTGVFALALTSRALGSGFGLDPFEQSHRKWAGAITVPGCGVTRCFLGDVNVPLKS